MGLSFRGSNVDSNSVRDRQIVKELERRVTICRVDWGLPLLQADVGVLGLPPSFPVVPQYLGHTSVVPQPLTEPDKQLSHIRLFTQTFGLGKTGSWDR